jgi:hypothetical protein
MSKQERIIQLLMSNEVFDGIIEQSLYDFLVESIRHEYKLTLTKARKAVTTQLRALYAQRTGHEYAS